MSVSVSPHEYRRQRRSLRDVVLRRPARCDACYEPESHHPTRGWIPARPMGDRSDRLTARP